MGSVPTTSLIPRSVDLLHQGQAHLAAGRFVEADEAFETSLAVDPRNRAAYNALARVAQRQKLFGQSIRYTKKALLLEPNDRDAIAIQGEAMVELGAAAARQGKSRQASETLPDRLHAACRAERDDRARPDGRLGQGAGSSEEELRLGAGRKLARTSTNSAR